MNSLDSRQISRADSRMRRERERKREQASEWRASKREREREGERRMNERMKEENASLLSEMSRRNVKEKRDKRVGQEGRGMREHASRDTRCDEVRRNISQRKPINKERRDRGIKTHTSRCRLRVSALPHFVARSRHLPLCSPPLSHLPLFFLPHSIRASTFRGELKLIRIVR